VRLKILPFAATAPFQGTSFVYRYTDVEFESDYYDEWFASPPAMIGERAAIWLGGSHLFSGVLLPSSSLDGDLELSGTVAELYGDYREAARSVAVVAVQFQLVGATEGTLYYDQLLRETVDFNDRTPEAFARAADEALARVLARLEADLRQLSLTRKP